MSVWEPRQPNDFVWFNVFCGEVFCKGNSRRFNVAIDGVIGFKINPISVAYTSRKQIKRAFSWYGIAFGVCPNASEGGCTQVFVGLRKHKGF